MIYKLETETVVENKRRRVYVNSQTGAECVTQELYKDKMNRVWFGFVDLFKIPYIRVAFSQHISNLFGVGLTKEDLGKWCNELKTTLKNGNDPERYEKAYASILNTEALINSMADPVKQHLSLCTVYVLREDEKIDVFSEELAGSKMKDWAMDLQAQSFFLNWHLEHIQRYTENWKNTLEIASQKGILEQFQL